MQYNIKVTTMKGENTPGNKSKFINDTMMSYGFETEPTVKEVKDVAKTNQSIKDFSNDEIISGVLIVSGEEAKDDNAKVPQRTFINYVLTIK